MAICYKKRTIVAIFFRFVPIDSQGLLLYACNGTLYSNIPKASVKDCIT